jgi:5'-deoxynucleotidase YfbR-like HD superfamily hydrolase
MNLRNVLASGDVQRYHNAPVERKQLLSSHMWEVGIILQHIYPKCSKDLLFYAMTHDCEELFTGDIPAPVKVEHPEVRSVLVQIEEQVRYNRLELDRPVYSIEERLAVKYADILSGIYHCAQEIKRGNTLAIPVRDAFLDYISRLPYLNHQAADAIGDLK